MTIKQGRSYSPAKKIDLGNAYLVFVSGVQAPKNDNHEVITDNIKEQTELVVKNIEIILKKAGATLDNVVKAVIYLTDMKDFDVFHRSEENILKTRSQFLH